MENIPLTTMASGIQLEGFPDGIKVIKVDGPQAQRLSDLALHRADLDFADECLNAIDHAPEHFKNVFQQALWRSAIVHYTKCFGNHEVRFQLSFDKVYQKGTSINPVHFVLWINPSTRWRYG